MTASVHQYSNEEHHKHISAIIGISSGNLVEWFDFYVYAFYATYFTPAFFPSDNPTMQLLSTAGVFAAGLLMHPIGSWMLGHITDRHGCKTAMLISAVMICTGSLAIACMSTYASIDTLVPAPLLSARMFQGLSVSGEYGTSTTYMGEVTLKGQRGFFASFQYVTLIGGQLLVVLVVVVPQQLLSEDELRAWGQQVPFVIDTITVVIAFWLRRSLNETVSKPTLKRKESGTFAELFKHKWALFTMFDLTTGDLLIFYTFTTYMQKYLVNTVGTSAKTTSAVMTLTLFMYILMQPLFGMLSDRIGCKTSMLWFDTLGTPYTLPILLTLKTMSSSYMAFFLIILALATISLHTPISGLIKAETFPLEVRALGVGVSYAAGNAIFSDSVEYVVLGLKSTGTENISY